MVVKALRNKEISGGEKNGGGKGVGPAIRRRIANWWSINIKE